MKYFGKNVGVCSPELHQNVDIKDFWGTVCCVLLLARILTFHDLVETANHGGCLILPEPGLSNLNLHNNEYVTVCSWLNKFHHRLYRSLRHLFDFGHTYIIF